MSPYLTMALKTVIRLVTVFARYLILHQEVYLKIYHVRAKFNVLGKSDL